MADEDVQIEKERELFKLINKRRGKLSALTRKRNEIDAYIEAGESKQVVSEHMDLLNTYLEQFMQLQVDVQKFLENEDEREADHTDWYEPKLLAVKDFIERIKVWMGDGGEEAADVVHPEDSVSQIGDSAGAQENDPVNAATSNTKMPDKASEVSTAVSRASSRSSKSSRASVKQIQAEVERAVIHAKVQSLQEKHALEMEELQLKARKETLSLKTDLAVADAKIQVFTALRDKQDSVISAESKSTSLFTTLTTTEFIPPATVSKPTEKPHKSPTNLNLKVSPVSFPLNPPRPSVGTKAEHLPVQIAQKVPVGAENNALVEVLSKQNEITEMLVKQQRMASLPPVSIPIFDGNPLYYRSFIKAFEQGIEAKTNDQKDCLYYLEQFTTGQPRNLVRSYIYMDSRVAYREAKAQLEWNFGNKVKITSAFMNKALGWSDIKSDDAYALRSYALFLRSCFNTLEEAGFIEELENSSNMKTFASKLPFRLRDKWRVAVFNIGEKRNHRPKFKDLLEFVEKQAKAALDPVYGELQNSKEKLTSKNAKSAQKPSNFAISVSPVSEQSKPKWSQKSKSKFESAVKTHCLFCDGNHMINLCDLFKMKLNKEKIDFIKSKGLCFRCLQQGHKSVNCVESISCEICEKTHPTVLHIYPKETPKQDQIKSLENKETLMSTDVSFDADTHTGAGIKECTLSVIPVKVKLSKGCKIVETYAFLDPGSSATFCTEELMRQLNGTGKKAEILLKTMGQEKLVSTFKLSGLEVSALTENAYLKLPDVYTQKSIPITKDSIPKEEDIRKWPYLKEVELSLIDASIGLLIGVNVPKALEPWKVVNSEGNGPYAVLTRLGWVINGPLRNCKDVDGQDSACVKANYISVSSLEDMFVKQYNQDFVEQHCDEQTEMSVEDKQFMEIMENSAELKDGHYYLKLPFRNSDVRLPNNKQIAQQRAQCLLKRFNRDESFFLEYKDFMSNLNAEGYSEIVPHDELECEKGKVWYIPHHGVYHPQKKTLRVVYDCASTFAGASLNKELLQGPDLTNTLLGVLMRFRQGPIALMTDIKGMFHQVRVSKEHVNFLRYLWWPDGDLSKELVEHRMLVHIFGAVSSPSCATYALLKTANDNQDLYPSEIIDTIRCNFYVDDCLKCVYSVEQALSLYTQLTEVCAKGGFRLNKWICSDRAVLSQIPEENRAKGAKTLDLSKDELPMERALGVEWDVERDVFTFSITSKKEVLTRRGILSALSSIYDPLGFLSPVILTAKQILQHLCKLKFSWDESIPLDLAQKWQRWIDDLTLLDSFSINRCFTPRNFGNVSLAQLHHFCDASEVGYGAVSYLRLTNEKKEVCVALERQGLHLLSKLPSRVLSLQLLFWLCA